MRKWREKRYKHDEVEVMNFYLNSRTPNLFSVRLIFFIFFVYLQALKVNLIITDYTMPGMTGYELLKKIKVSPPVFLF